MLDINREQLSSCIRGRDDVQRGLAVFDYVGGLESKQGMNNIYNYTIRNCYDIIL